MTKTLTRNRLHVDPNVAALLRADLFAMEDAIDAAYTQAANFAGSLASLRHRANVSAIFGQEVFEGAAAAITRLSEARRDTVAMHKQLALLERRAGIQVTAGGPFGDKDEGDPTDGG
jgi:hypothetical protein